MRVWGYLDIFKHGRPFQGWGACPSSTVFQARRKLNMSEDVQGLSIHRASEGSCPEPHHGQHRGREQGRGKD